MDKKNRENLLRLLTSSRINDGILREYISKGMLEQALGQVENTRKGIQKQWDTLDYISCLLSDMIIDKEREDNK